MPKPTPEYIPGELRDQIAAMGFSGVLELSESVGLSRTRLLRVFGTNHGKLIPYYNFSKFAGVTMDELAALMVSGKMGDLIDRVAKEKNLSVNAMEKVICVGEGFLKNKRTGKCTANGLRTYIEVANALGWSLQKLTEICLS